MRSENKSSVWSCHTGGGVVHGTEAGGGGAGQADHAIASCGRPVPVPAQGVPQHLPDAADAEGHWLHLWIHMVGIRPQSHRILHRISCTNPTNHDSPFIWQIMRRSVLVDIAW